MLTGLEILLARMKTNPEEFLKDGNVPYDGETFGGKWADLLDYGWRVANEEERKALRWQQDYQDKFQLQNTNPKKLKWPSPETETPVRNK